MKTYGKWFITAILAFVCVPSLIVNAIQGGIIERQRSEIENLKDSVTEVNQEFNEYVDSEAPLPDSLVCPD